MLGELNVINLIELIGLILGSSALTLIVQKIFSRKKDRLDIESVLYSAWKDSIQDNIKISKDYKDHQEDRIKDIEDEYNDQINVLLERIDSLEKLNSNKNDNDQIRR